MSEKIADKIIINPEINIETLVKQILKVFNIL
jgi:hypothetical protein